VGQQLLTVQREHVDLGLQFCAHWFLKIPSPNGKLISAIGGNVVIQAESHDISFLLYRVKLGFPVHLRDTTVAFEPVHCA
jgi:hypothetical protein